MTRRDRQTDAPDKPAPDKRVPYAKPPKFDWPPRPLPEPDAEVVEPEPKRAPADMPLSAWEEFEREWLGVATPPLHRRLADAGVKPDPLNVFCWRCGRSVGPFETDAKGCSHCRDARPPWSRFVRLGEYDAPWDRIVQDAKFTRWPRLSVDLGRLLGRQVGAAVPDLRDRPTVVVPVPTNLWRRLSRGTDHSLNLARGVAKELQLPIRPMLRRANRPEQARLSRTDRETNLRNAMSRAHLDGFWAFLRCTAGARWPNRAASARLIVVDDISTTGATMVETCRTAREVCKALEIKNLEVVCATVCRTEGAR